MAGADGVVEAHPLLVVEVVAAPQEVLAARVVRLLVHHPAAAVHPDGVAAAEAGLQVGAVAAALVAAALEAPVLVDGDLQVESKVTAGSQLGGTSPPPHSRHSAGTLWRMFMQEKKDYNSECISPNVNHGYQ